MTGLTMRRCGRCRELKPLEDFSPRKKGGWQGYCRTCLRQYKQEYYQKNRDKYIARSLAHKRRLKAILLEAKNQPCSDCKRRFPPYVLDFDHREGERKLFNVSELNAHRWVSVRVLLAEIAKCDLVCANCHRIRTHERRCRERMIKRADDQRGVGGRAANGTRL